MKRLFKRPKNDQEAAPRRRRAGDNNEIPSSAQSVSQRYAFRRNRTLTGSSSAQIASGNELNAELRSPRAHVHHLTSLRRRLFMYFLVVGFVSFLLYILVNQLVASAAIRVSGVDVLDSSDEGAYAKALDQYYGARPIERFRFLLNNGELTLHMQAVRPEIEDVEVEPGSKLGEAGVTIRTRAAIARWSIDGNNQYVDSDGVVFSRNYHALPALQIIDNSGIRTSDTQVVASNRFLGFVGRLIATAKTSGLTVTRVTIPTLTTRQVRVSLEGRRTEYRFLIDRSVGQQVEDMVRIDTFLKKRGLHPSYVDVRVEGKAFYR